ncbi:nucleotidyltransferase family protein [Tropicimonas marinistellae]|uniref:nucleotidyltransferase family protein n=1 Tax=Tropicimonas marinistellae TaxID=1739787 RepID=UPI0008368531|nr:nucleotidyltransferase family protein [Tropicimonas marinistellae]
MTTAYDSQFSEQRIKPLCRLLENLVQRFPQDIPNLAPLLYVARRVEPDNPTLRDLDLAFLRNFRSIARQTSEHALTNSCFVLNELQKRGIPALAIKGTVLSHLSYGDPNFRVSNDIDLVVKPADSRKAIKALQLIGLRFAKEQDRSACQIHMTSPVVGTLDLHTRLAPRWFPLGRGFEARFENPNITVIGGNAVPTFSIPEHILICAINSVKEFPKEIVRKSLVDMAALAAPLDEIQMRQLREDARTNGLARILSLAFALLKELGYEPPSGQNVEEINAQSVRTGFRQTREMSLKEVLEKGHEGPLSQSGFARYHMDLRERLRDRVKARMMASLLPVIPLAQTRAKGLRRPDAVLGALIRRGVTNGALKERYLQEIWQVRPHIHQEVFDDGGLVFDEWSRQIHTLNPAGAFLLDQIRAGEAVSQTVEAYQAARGQDRKRALREITDILSWWNRSGWIGEMPEEDAAFRDQFHPTASCQSAEPPTSYDATSWNLIVAGVPLRITVESDVVIGKFEELIAPFEDVHSDGASAIRVHVFREDGGIVIEVDDEEAAFCSDSSVLPDVLLDSILVAAVGHLPYVFYLHSAVVEISDGAVMLPAPSGSGKSTLSIALSRRGARYISDEMTLLNADFDAYGVHVFPTVKESGWTAMRNIVVDLKRFPDFRRRDGIAMKYLTEGFVRDPRTVPEALAVHGIVFPTFEPNAVNCLEKIGPVASFSMLMEQCLSMNEGFSVRDFRRLATFLRETPSYSVTYRDTDFAVSGIFDIVGSQAEIRSLEGASALNT